MIKIITGILLLFSCSNHSGNKPSATDTIPGQPGLQKETIVSNEEINIDTSGRKAVLLPHPIRLKNGVSFDLNIPQGYNVSIAAEGLKRLRFMAQSPDGKLFATDMYDKSDNHKGRVLLFTNWNDQRKQFNTVITFLDGLHNPNQVAFYKNYLYVAETDKLSRYVYNPGDTKPSSAPEIIARFPDYGLRYKYGGWHLTRSIAFNNNKLYVSVGSSCNACIESEEIRASIIEMNPDGTDKNYFARGVRNAVGMKWIGNKLWVTGMGRDLIGPDKPEDLFQQIEKGNYYGWPFYFQYQQKIYADTAFKDSAKTAWVKRPPLAFCGFKAHSAPLGFDFMKDFADPTLKNSFLVCLHGSTSVWRQRGNCIVKVMGGNKYINVIDGFLTGKTDKDRHGRPCDILMKDTRSFFFTDDLNGVLYYIWK